MISTYLVAHPWLTTVLLVLCLVGGPLAAATLRHRPRLALALGVVAVLPVLGLTLAPAAAGPGAVTCALEWSWPTLGRVELVANVVLLVPPALLFAVALRRPWLVLAAAGATSALIELTQAVVTALHRACSTNDWATNTLGALLGVAIGAGVLRLLPERDRASTQPPRETTRVLEPSAPTTA